MTKVGIAQLKAHLSRYVRDIRRGETVMVLDRNEPVARIVPFQTELKRVTEGVCSSIAQVECLRTLDRLQHQGRREAVYRGLGEAARAFGFAVIGC